MNIFENKTVLITGGTSGIGKATALAFSQQGANVVVSGRRVAEGENVVREITSAGAKALFVRTDVSREEEIIALIEKTVATFGALHVAFNNAGIEGQIGLLTTEQTVEQYRQVCDINICGVLLSMKHEIRAMLRSGGGAIVNNSSIAGAFWFSRSVRLRRQQVRRDRADQDGCSGICQGGNSRQQCLARPDSDGNVRPRVRRRSNRQQESTRSANSDWPRRHAERDCQRRALAQFSGRGLHHGAGHYHRRWHYRALVQCNVEL